MARFDKIAISKALKEECRVNWKITNFSEIRGSKEALEAQTYYFEMGSSIKLASKLKCYLTCNSVDGRIWINPNVGLDGKPSGNISELFATLQVEVNEKSVFRSDTSPMSNILTDVLSYSPLIPQVELDPHFRNYVNADGSLCLSLIVTLYNFENIPNRPYVRASLFASQLKFEAKSREKLEQDMSKLFNNPDTLSQTLTMRKVVSGDDKEFFINPDILTIRCPVLYCMLAEETSSVLTLSDISGQHLETLLGFLHTATLPLDWKLSNETTDELVYVAKKFGLTDLVEFLEQSRYFALNLK